MSQSFLRKSLLLIFSAIFSTGVFSQTVKKTPQELVQHGVFTLRIKGANYLVEIPRRLLGRDFLLGCRLMEISSAENRSNLTAGQRLYDPVMVRFAIEKDKLLMLQPDPEHFCDPGDPIYASFMRNNAIPTAEAFEIEQQSDSSVTINMSKFFAGDLPSVEPFNEKSRPGKLLTNLSGIVKAEVFAENMEFTVQNFYETSKEPFKAVVRKSLLLLPEKPMQARLYDPRTSYDVVKRKVYSSTGATMRSESFITRFNLQPAEKNRKAFLQGKLVEPVKPIVFYVDTAFPKAWRKAIIQGIEDWQPAFEKIGFSKAIVAREYPRGADFNADDSRFNCFRLSVCDRSNAMGVHWCDPRSGEIVQAEVLYYSNVIALLQKWYFLQTAAVNPQARKKTLDDAVLLPMIRYSAAHEIGHSLGLNHNFEASFGYPTEKLRDPAFTAKYGTTPSIMDYARFNYVAQPGDKDVALMPPHLGVYDYFSIQFGYQYIPGVKQPDDERTVLNKWLEEKANDPMYTFGRNGSISIVQTDPSKQTADLGNDPVASSAYGIRNLKFILQHLKEWMLSPGDSYDEINTAYDNIRQETFSYLDNALPMIAGVIVNQPVAGGSMPLYTLIGKKQTEQAVHFIISELRNQGNWLDNSYVRSFAGPQTETLCKQQRDYIEKMLSEAFFKNMVQYEGEADRTSVSEYLRSLTNALFDGQKDDIFSNNLRWAYLQKLQSILKDSKTAENFTVPVVFPAASDEIDYIVTFLKKRGDSQSLQLLKLLSL